MKARTPIPAIPHAGPDASLIGAFRSVPERCGHGKTWDEECSECNSIWRETCIADLAKQAARYGFRLIPKNWFEEGESSLHAVAVKHCINLPPHVVRDMVDYLDKEFS
ncbi:MAG: hypothetical protein KGL39_29580 [Patescibacteria group bacterium]|nr:hypothetical protein [Patescibacteria group bacterium]